MKCDVYDLIIAMMNDNNKSMYDCINRHYYSYRCNECLRINGEYQISIFKKLMTKSGYIKYLDFDYFTIFNDVSSKFCLVTLNDLGNKERNNIENLFRLKGLLK